MSNLDSRVFGLTASAVREVVSHEYCLLTAGRQNGQKEETWDDRNAHHALLVLQRRELEGQSRQVRMGDVTGSGTYEAGKRPRWGRHPALEFSLRKRATGGDDAANHRAKLIAPQAG